MPAWARLDATPLPTISLPSIGGKFDVILNEPSNLWIAGMAGLFTQEFYWTCEAHLADGGLMGQWLHAYGVTGVPETVFISPDGRIAFKQISVTTYDLIERQIRSMSKAATLWTPWRTLGGEKPTAPFHPLLAPAISASSRSVTFGGPPRLW